ncbi:hypothetical protein BJD66_gp56 [Gordonia phage Emalyn]|uniref:Uncharacterized protein n=1 Tax=Gordonia phage Emalyn TaxID=1821552 RepID=A0A142KBZ2_9CAUD|nr:hypothetical protein BJD66_gp56 [Gordonia phage Emalyn]AMS03625.1 hypothetical protein SEA_EMALYN_56 [Gordonia phage Emalyn]
MSITPITLRDLLSYEEYKAYFKRAPRPFMSSTPQWAIVAISHEGKYGKVFRDSFPEAFKKGKEILAREDIRDISIFCKNRIAPVPDFASHIMSPAEDWCGRCRRPSIFKLYGKTHPALRDAPVIVEHMRRCYFCGISLEYVSRKVVA